MALKVAFLFNAQDHHIPHSLPIACALSRDFADVEVTVLARSEVQIALCRRLAALYPGQQVAFDRMRVPRVARLARRVPKLVVLWANRRRLDGFDALVVPERTSLHLKRMGVRRPKYIHAFHGSSGHDRVDDPRLAEFDLLLAPSARRLGRIGAARPGASAVIGYSKLDLVERMGAAPQRLFANDRPTILYNPHHWAHKSSWHVAGPEILEHLAARQGCNLIFAPHVRLFDPPERHRQQFAAYEGQENVRIDLGSERSIDMSYTLGADIYVGDVSSQVFEFILRPRPCIFLNPCRLAWQDDPDFASWRLGRVVETLAELDEALATVPEWAPSYEAAQRTAAAEAFEPMPTPAPERGARAIAAFLRNGTLRPGWDA